MSKFIQALVVFFILINQTHGGEIDKKLHKNCIYPTVLVTRANDGGYGSGVIVRSEKVDNIYKNVFLTCAHIIDTAKPDYEVKQFIYEDWSQVKEIKSFPATFAGYNTDMDIAIGVFVSDTEMPTAELDFQPKIFIGNELFRIGCGLGDEPRLDYGKLTNYKKGVKPLFRTSIMTVPGD